MSSSLLRFLKNPFFVPILGDKSILLINVNRSRVRFIIDIQLYFKVLFTSWLESDSSTLLLVMHYFESTKQTICLAHSVVWRDLLASTKRRTDRSSNLSKEMPKRMEDRENIRGAANNIHVQKVLSFISLGLLIMDLAGIERKDFSYVQIYYLKSRACHHHHHHRHHHGHGSKKTFFKWNFPKYFFPNYGGGTKMDNTSFLRFFLKVSGSVFSSSQNENFLRLPHLELTSTHVSFFKLILLIVEI